MLAFQILHKPDCATFNPATGAIAGTPPPETNGTFTDIQISVTDGEMNTALPAFSISVTGSTTTPETGTGSVTLSWAAPTHNDDGSPLTDLPGYRIYFGTAPDNLSQRLDIVNSAATSAEVPGLSAGTWYFAMTSLNGAGIESTRTSAVSNVL